MTRSTFTPDAERQRRTPDMGTVVCVSATHSKQNGNSPCITMILLIGCDCASQGRTDAARERR